MPNQKRNQFLNYCTLPPRIIYLYSDVTFIKSVLVLEKNDWNFFWNNNYLEIGDLRKLMKKISNTEIKPVLHVH